MVKRNFLTAALILCIALGLQLNAQALTVEQTRATPPEFSVYFYETETDISSLRPSDVSAYYDGVPMEVTGLAPANQTGAAIHYIYALDISGSMPYAVFQASKTVILEAFDGLRPNETLSLVTFGDSVKLVLSEVRLRDELKTTLDSLYANNKSTDFNGAVSKLTEISEEYQKERTVGIIFSDGMDDIYAGLTRNELESKLRRGALSINAMCVNGSATTAVSQFGELARLSGGELYLYNAKDCSAKLTELLERADSCYALTLKTSSNMVDGKSHAISFKLGQLPVQTIEVTPTISLPDKTAPKVTEMLYDTEQAALLICFSEPVSGADELGSYAVSLGNGKVIRPVSVKYSEETAVPTAALRFDGKPYKGKNIVTFSGIYDTSMEKNPLENAEFSTVISKGRIALPTWAYYAIAGGLLLIAALVSAFALMKNKNQKRETEERISAIEGRPGHVVEGAEIKGQVIIPKAQGIKVQLAIFDGKGKKYKVTQDIVTSLFIGKHSGNDLVIEDNRISRQHAVMEKLEDAIAIQDLNSTNGTLVNGTRIQPGVSQRVAKDDEISMGDTTIRILGIG